MTGPASAEYRPRSRMAQAIAGAFIAGVGVSMAWIAWTQTVRDAEFSLRGSMLGPAFVVIGLGLAAFGGYKEERLARGESLEGLQGAQLITPRWWGSLVLSLVAAGAYTFALWSGWLLA